MDHENDREMLDWQGEDCYLSEETNLGIPQCPCNGEDVSYYMFDETTPVKACGDFYYHGIENVSVDKEAEQSNELFLQAKRRRMLQFQNEEMPSVFLKTKDREDSFEEALADMSEWVSSFSDSCEYTDLDQLSERWLAYCFSNSEMNYNPNDVSLSKASDVQIDISDFCNTPPEHQSTIDKRCPTPRRQNIVFKGRKSCVQTRAKMASSVAYPFDIIKPCDYYGDTTLKEINKRLHNSSSLRHKLNSEDPSLSYPTSAFSGKPVVGKTTIQTQGGRGSITIMKTKG